MAISRSSKLIWKIGEYCYFCGKFKKVKWAEIGIKITFYLFVTNKLKRNVLEPGISILP